MFNVLKEYKIRYRFHKNKHNINCWGYAMAERITIVIYGRVVRLRNGKITINKMKQREFLSTLFHEIQHILMYRKGMFKLYHSAPVIRNLSDRQFAKWKAEILPAERMADKLAERMMKKYHPKVKYIAHYKGKQGVRIVNGLKEYASYLRED